MSDAWLARRGAEPTLSWMVAFSVFLHVAAGVAIVLVSRRWTMRPPTPIVAYTVKIVDPSSLGGRLPQGPIRAEPVTSVAQPERREEPKPEPPKPEEKVVKLPDVAKKPEPKPEPKKPEPNPEPKKPPATPKPSKAELAKIERDKDIQEAIKRLGEKGASKKAGGLGGTEEAKRAALGSGGEGGGGGVLTGLDFIIYKNQVEGLIKRNWTWVGANPDLTIRVGFRIGDDGQIGDLRVIDRSGDSSFDDSVMRAIRISSPLPAPPAKYREVFADYVLEFVSGELAAGG